MNAVGEINLSLYPKQALALNSKAREILYGGAAGGGKSHALRVIGITLSVEIPGLQTYLFRRTYPELKRNHMEGATSFRAMLAPWVLSGHVEIVADEIRFWNGSKIFLCHCDDEADVYKYQGAEFHVLLLDELTHFTEVQYRYLRSRVRMTNINVPSKFEGSLPKIISGSNPGGTGHLWVKEAFVDSSPPYQIHTTDKIDGGFTRQYIPATLDDNPSLAGTSYESTLLGMGSEALVEALRYGNWDICEGAFFSEFKREKHVVDVGEVPIEWSRFTAMDWGSARPFCVLWFAISDGVYGDLPRGALYVYKEWYGGNKNKGLKYTAETVARGILARSNGERIVYNRADPSMFKEDGGMSLAERFWKCGVKLAPADNTRVTGWEAIRSRLTGEDDKPMLYISPKCLHLIRTLPFMQHDTTKPEDIDTDMEDHAVDALRYGCMSRPYLKVANKEETPKEQMSRILIEKERQNTFGKLWDEHIKEFKRNKRRIKC